MHAAALFRLNAMMQGTSAAVAARVLPPSFFDAAGGFFAKLVGFQRACLRGALHKLGIGFLGTGRVPKKKHTNTVGAQEGSLQAVRVELDSEVTVSVLLGQWQKYPIPVCAPRERFTCEQPSSTRHVHSRPVESISRAA